MTRDVLIGVDAGTSVIKSVAFSLDGKQLDAFAIPNSYDTLQDGGVEQDMARTWADCAASLRGLAERVPNLAARASAIAITGQGDGCWLIDKAGAPVGGGWLWLDARAASIIDALRNSPAGARHFAITGCGLAACQQSGQLLWMRQHQPERLAKAAAAFHCKDWLYLNLTGVRATDPTEALFTFGDFRKRAYSEEVIANLGLAPQRGLLAPIVDGMAQRHALSAEAAKATGLLAGTPVMLGYVDVICTALGAGLYDPAGAVGCSVVGSTGMHMRMAKSADDVALNKDATGYTMPFPVPGMYAQMQTNMASTLNIDWLIDLARGVLADADVERSRKDIIAGLDARVLAAKSCQLVYHPYISEAGERGPFVDANARASFIGLSLRHGFGDLARAVYEGLAFAARDCFDATGAVPAEVRLTGGAARSKALRKIIGAALNTRLRSNAREEAGAAGVAMMAAVSLGQYKTMDDCLKDWVTPLLGEAEAPDAELAARYAAHFPAYQQSRKALAPTWRAMAQTRAAS
jgi:erythritol kinase (D-erythritol 1-phosphate-forming)